MKKKFILLNIIIACIIQFACSEEINLELNQVEKKIVIQALITDQPGPYFVRLTKTTNTLQVPYNPMAGDHTDNAEIIAGATVIISDDTGNIDTLIPSPFHHYIVNTGGDSLIGYYCTQHIRGVAGRNYYIKITAEDKEYFAETTMIPVPDIDSIFFNIKEGDVGKENKVIPLAKISDKENEGKYLLFTTGTDQNILRYNALLFSLIEKQNINSNFFSLFNDASAEGIYYLDPVLLSDTVQFNIYSITKESYNFHKEIIKQFENDGGAFKPDRKSVV